MSRLSIHDHSSSLTVLWDQQQGTGSSNSNDINEMKNRSARINGTGAEGKTIFVKLSNDSFIAIYV